MKDLNEFTSKYACEFKSSQQFELNERYDNFWFNSDSLDCCIVLVKTTNSDNTSEWGLEFVTSENFHKLQFDYELVKSKRNPIKLRTYFKVFINAIKNDIRFDIDCLEFYCDKEREKVYLKALKGFDVVSLLGANTYQILLNSWTLDPTIHKYL